MKWVRFFDGKEGKNGIVEEDIIKCEDGGIYRFDKVKILPPCQPSKIIAVGLNYKDHAKELNLPIPDEPILFMKPSTSIIGHEDNIIYPYQAQRVDYEAELAVIIKDKAKDLEPDEVFDKILGFTCFNDVTARDIQKKDIQWTRAKSFDTFSPIGPFVVNGIDPNNLKIESYLNGELKQSSNTNNLIFRIEELVSFISKVMTLLPEDVITTGTPAGIGAMNRGDIIEVKIEKIGTLRNYVI
jgi:2-keto-4-pentenoate hydratase/2-oxohepta-3-ene-1,7-dioic acid hydratase in catechol pathway